MASSSAWSAPLVVLAFVAGAVGYLVGKANVPPASPAPPPTIVSGSSASAPPPVVQYLPQTGEIVVVEQSTIYKVDAKTLDVLNRNDLSEYSVPIAVRKARRAESDRALKAIMDEQEAAQKRREAEAQARLQQEQANSSPSP